ncbi:MAG: preprotein translocase subunit SecE [bacterium]
MKNKILTYLNETLAEVKKVVWPDRRYVTVATIIVLALVFITAIFVMLVDYGFSAIFKVLLK